MPGSGLALGISLPGPRRRPKENTWLHPSRALRELGRKNNTGRERFQQTTPGPSLIPMALTTPACPHSVLQQRCAELHVRARLPFEQPLLSADCMPKPTPATRGEEDRRDQRGSTFTEHLLLLGLLPHLGAHAPALHLPHWSPAPASTQPQFPHQCIDLQLPEGL